MLADGDHTTPNFLATFITVMSLFATKDACRGYGPRRAPTMALDHVTMEIAEGSFTAITGPSGSGKSSLLAILGALDRATSGEVRFGDTNLCKCSESWLARCRRKIGYVFQQFSLIPRMSIADNITYALIPRGIRKTARDRIARDLLETLELSDKFDQRPEQLSGGEQQRISLARALAVEPEVLIGDEPTSNLDVDTASIVIGKLTGHAKRGGTVVVATHDAAVLDVADQVVELNHGKITSTYDR